MRFFTIAAKAEKKVSRLGFLSTYEPAQSGDIPDKERIRVAESVARAWFEKQKTAEGWASFRVNSIVVINGKMKIDVGVE